MQHKNCQEPIAYSTYTQRRAEEPSIFPDHQLFLVTAVEGGYACEVKWIIFLGPVVGSRASQCGTPAALTSTALKRSAKQQAQQPGKCMVCCCCLCVCCWCLVLRCGLSCSGYRLRSLVERQ